MPAQGRPFLHAVPRVMAGSVRAARSAQSPRGDTRRRVEPAVRTRLCRTRGSGRHPPPRRGSGPTGRPALPAALGPARVCGAVRSSRSEPLVLLRGRPQTAGQRLSQRRRTPEHSCRPAGRSCSAQTGARCHGQHSARGR